MAEQENSNAENGEKETGKEENLKIDFSNVEGRKLYLKKKLDDLMDSIGDSYGKTLMEELIFRLEKTVKDFNLEVSEMMKKLHLLEEERQKFIDRDEEEGREREPKEEYEEMSEFERRLEEKEKVLNSGDSSSEKGSKKGLFRR